MVDEPAESGAARVVEGHRPHGDIMPIRLLWLPPSRDSSGGPAPDPLPVSYILRP